MAHGYPNGKYRGGKTDRRKRKDGPGKNAQHGSSENHSRQAKGNKKPKESRKKGNGFLGMW